MPFSGIRAGSKLERDIDKCVVSIRGDNPGMGKSQAIAICRSRLEKKMSGQEKVIDKRAGGKISIPDGGLNSSEGTELFVSAKGAHLSGDRDEDDLEKRGDETFINPGITSFAELDEVEEAQEAVNQIRKRTGQFNGIIDNIMMDPDVEDKGAAINDLATEFGVMAGEAMDRKERWQPLTDAVVNAISPLIDKQETPMKTEGGIKFPASDFAFTPSDKPSTWKLRLAEDSPGNITRSQLGAAAAAFSPGGFRGQRVKIPAGDVASAKAKIRAAYKKIGVKDEDIPPSVRKGLETKNSFMVHKEADGSYRWFAIYSNKFRDRDQPPEIISEASHLNFVKSVNSGELPFPELWLWHVDGSRWGIADFVGYDDNGFAVATGTVDKGREWVADSLKGDLLTSHGMPPGSIKREDPTDPTIITRHITKEISPLPASEAANEFTGFSILNEVKAMALSEQDKARLDKLEVDPIRFEAEAEEKAKETAELEFKETDNQETGEYVSREEVADLVKSVATSTNQLVEVVGDLAKRIKTLEANKLTTDKNLVEHTPAASLAEMYQSVIGAPETKVDGRTAFAKSGPEEAPPETPINSQTSISVLGAAIAKRNQEIEQGGVQ